jgi:hypothetical protein
MRLFRRKETSVSVTIESSAAMLERIKPLKDEIAALERRRDDHARRRSEAKAAYDQTCLDSAIASDGGDTQAMRQFKSEYDDLCGIISGIEKVINAKKAELAPLNAECQRLQRAEREAAAAAELVRFIDESRQEILNAAEQTRQAEKLLQEARVRLWAGKPGMSDAAKAQCRTACQQLDRELLKRAINS